MDWTKQDIEALESDIAFMLKQLGAKLNRFKEFKIALKRARELSGLGYHAEELNKLIANIEQILYSKEALMKEEERDIFSWNEIDAKTRALDTILVSSAKAKLSADMKHKLDEISQDKKLFKQGKHLVKLDKKFHKAFEDLKKIHAKLEEKLKEILAYISKNRRKLDLHKIYSDLLKLQQLIEEDQEISEYLKGNAYIHNKIMGILRRDIFKGIEYEAGKEF